MVIIIMTVTRRDVSVWDGLDWEEEEGDISIQIDGVIGYIYGLLSFSFLSSSPGRC